MQSTYCVHAVSFLLRLANSPQSDHQWFSERQTGMPPEARAKGVAAKALAKAAFAVKAKAQSAGLAKGRGAGPQGTLRPSEPAPVATRRYGRKAVPACLQRHWPRDRLPRQRPRQWRPARASFPAAKPEVKAGKRKKCQAKQAQAKASAAEPPAEVMAERAASEANVGHLSDRLRSLSSLRVPHLCAPHNFCLD